MRWIALPTPLLVAAALFSAAAPANAQLPSAPNPAERLEPAARDTTPVILTGKELGDWAKPSNQTVQPPLMDVKDCPYTVNPQNFRPPTDGGADGITDGFEQNCPESYDPHNHYADPAVDTGNALGDGAPVDRLIGYRWDPAAKRFVEIPFQVDEQFTRYLDNSASGFAVYSGQDQHTTYAFPREGFRYTENGPESDPCRATATTPAAGDPVKGLDHNDEIAFMAADAGPQAPSDAKLPKGIESSRVLTVADPTNPDAKPAYVYVGLASENGPRPTFDATNGYVRYERDANADDFAFSQSSYDGYGNAATGYYCDENGEIVRNADGTPKIGRRRPRDTATITTDRYRFRYDGRWLMTKVEISEDGGKTYGPDLVDRWKARAFAQDPGSETPCCGYEEEDNNWGGSSTLLGEKVGPVRAIRETWGADSGTNVIRRETFYRHEMKQKTYLRVHVIPALDGIYAQWDFNAGRVDTFTNSRGSHVVDGKNDEAYGNFDDPCNPLYDTNDTSDVDQGYRTLYETMRLCTEPWNEYHQSIDLPDLEHGDPNAGTDWSMVSGDNGSIVDRITVDITQTTPGGAAQSLVAVPYYRDDACFDDGTGSDPGLHVRKRSADEPRKRADGVTDRKCWDAEIHGTPQDDSDEFFQGSIATHGVHILTVAESDNARLTVPVNEIVSEWDMVMLPGKQEAIAGEQYGRSFEKPLVAVASALGAPAGGAEDPEPEPCPEGQVRDESGACVTPEPEPCPEGQVRNESGACVTPEPEPCPEGQTRNEAGVCVAPEPQPEPCPEGEIRGEDGKCKKADKPKGDDKPKDETPKGESSKENASSSGGGAGAPASGDGSGMRIDSRGVPASAYDFPAVTFPSVRAAAPAPAARAVTAKRRAKKPSCAAKARKAKSRAAKRAARRCAAARRAKQPR